jgi:Uma2 family endonuclease
MALRSRSLTIDDLLQLRETSDERLELLDGEIVVTPAPAGRHQLVVMRLAALLTREIIEAGLGLALPAPFDIVLDEENLVQPDLFILLHDRAQQMEKARVTGPPSLAIEVVSPSSAARDRGPKRNLYAKHGVPEYWLINPDDQNALILSDPYEGRYRKETLATETLVSATIPGSSVDLKTLFAVIPGF